MTISLNQLRTRKQIMKKPIFTEKNIQLDRCFENKWDAIQAAGEILYKQGYVTKEYLDDMKKRENIASAYIGNLVAIPHGVDGSEMHIIHSGISLLQVPNGVMFDTNKAHLIIGIAGKEGNHIEILSQIALLLMDLNVVEKLIYTKDIQYIMNLFNTFK